MKCVLCGGDATIIDHWFGIHVLGGGAQEEFVNIALECPICPNSLRQEVRATGFTEEKILAHPRHYTQLRNEGRV